MKSTLTAADVLADIEFELLQGSISRDALGEGIQTVRQHQNKIRSLAFDSADGESAQQEVLSHQFQLNDMLLTLLQEMAGSLQEINQTAEWLGQQRRGAGERPLFSKDDNASLPLKSTDSLTQTMTLNAIHQEMEVTPTGRPIPIVNGFIRRLRLGLHNLVLFYVNKLAKDQARVNHTQADWLMHLNAINRHQQEEIEELTRIVQNLQEKVNALEGKTAA
ncbi:MAG: hypothetical protein AAF490_07710 [Chloroflexota bacterium]